MRQPLAVALVILAASASTAFAACDASVRSGARSARAACPEPKRFEPYDPDRARSGGRQGYVTSGGTEFRIGGRTRVEYQHTR